MRLFFAFLGYILYFRSAIVALPVSEGIAMRNNLMNK